MAPEQGCEGRSPETLCIANREREEKGKKTYTRSSLAMFIPHIVRVKKSLRGNNVGS